MKQGMTIEELAANFPEQVFEKLKDMNVSPSFNPGTSRAKDLFKSLLEGMGTLKSDVERIASADRIADVILRDAAKKAAVEFYQARRLKLVYGVASLLSLEGWKIAGIVAETLVREFTTSRKAKKAIRRGKKAQAANLPNRYLFHAVLSAGVSPATFFAKVTGEWEERFGDSVVLDDYGWLHGSIASMYGDTGSSDGAFLIIQTKDADTALDVKSWLSEIGAVRVSTPMMADIEVPALQGEPQPDPVAVIVPLETH